MIRVQLYTCGSSLGTKILKRVIRSAGGHRHAVLDGSLQVYQS